MNIGELIWISSAFRPRVVNARTSDILTIGWSVMCRKQVVAGATMKRMVGMPSRCRGMKISPSEFAGGLPHGQPGPFFSTRLQCSRLSGISKCLRELPIAVPSNNVSFPFCSAILGKGSRRTLSGRARVSGRNVECSSTGLATLRGR